MNLLLFFFLILFSAIDAAAQPNQATDPSTEVPRSYRPTIAVVIGILSVMFSFTFVLLMYAKFCHPEELFHNGADPQNGLGRGRFSGIDKTVIQSLPFFRFSSLKGSKEGLECAVCLTKFEDTEILRLLPKCKHAFHVDCVDQWLENHSSCPLCRYKVDPDDLTIFTYSNRLRFPREPSDLRDDPDVELFVQREPAAGGSSRFSIGSSFRKFDKGKRKESPVPEGEEAQDALHKFEHRIVVSDVISKNRWSDVNSSDLMLLNSEMLRDTSGQKFSSSGSKSERFTSTMLISRGATDHKDDKIREVDEESESKLNSHRRSFSASASGEPSTSNSDQRSVIPAGKRSMSEITKVARFQDSRIKTKSDYTWEAVNAAKEERVRKHWLRIARQTIQWLTGREKASLPPNSRQNLNV